MEKTFFALALIVAFSLASCTNMSRTQQGAVSGGAVGAGVGAGIGLLTGGSLVTGALIGGGLGAIGGGFYGNEQEKK